MAGSNRIYAFIFSAVMIMIAGTVIAFIPVELASARTLNYSVSNSEPNSPIVIYFFWGDGCPHCAAAKPFLAEISQKYPLVQLRSYEVWYVKENQVLLQKMAAAYGFEPSGVPTIFIGDRHWIGYSDTIGDEIQAAVSACAETGCKDAGQGVIPGIPTPSPSEMSSTPQTGVPNPAAISAGIITLPLIGQLDLSNQSLLVSTGLIALVDGFNPCSLWALSVLLALTLHTGSRKKVFLVGIVFLTVTSLIYALFILGLFTMFTVVSFVGWIQVAVAVVALFFAIVNIKDYFWYKEGISFTIPDEKKPGIYRGMRRVLDAGDSFWGLIAATVVLSAGVSLVEFSCTAGFPVLWTNLLISRQVAGLTFAALLLLYMFIYQIDELGIFFLAVFTLKTSKLEEKHGRLLKLLGGMLMLTLAMVMLINPAWMNQIGSSLLVFLAAFGLTGLVLALHRYLLPRFGISIGSELSQPQYRKRLSRQHHRRA